MKRIGAIALILGGTLVLAVGAQAQLGHQPLRCKAGLVRRTVWIPVRRHGRIVRRHGRIVRVKVQRCVKPKPKKSKPSSPGGTSTNPTTTQPPASPTRTTTTTKTTTAPKTTTTTTTTTAPPPSGGPPSNTAAPAISGTATQGNWLTASPGSWTNAPTSYGYQWQRCNTGGCLNVSGQTSATYLLVSQDVGSTMRVSVSASNKAGSTLASSAPTSIVASSGGSSGDPVVVAVGDIAHPSGCSSCAQTATAALAQKFSPNAVFVLGDNQYDSGSLSEYTGSYDLSWGHDFNSIVHPVPGNHEYATSGATGYFQYFGDNGVTAGSPGGYYSFNLGSWHIVALNSNCSNGCQDSLTAGETPAEMSWLQSDLAANRSACVLGMWHHPLFSDGWISGSPGALPLWTALYSAHADVVLNGHDHVYERYAQVDPSGTANANGIAEFVVGTGGESLNGLSTNRSTLLHSDGRDYGVLVLTLHASSYTWSFVNTGGATVDTGTAACHGPGAGAASVAHAHRAAPIDAARLAGLPLVFDAHPLRSSLTAVTRAGLPVAVLASRAVDVRVTAWLRQGHRLIRLASFYETESQITQPHSVIRLRFADRLKGVRAGALVLRFAAEDGAGHRHTVTRTVRLG